MDEKMKWWASVVGWTLVGAVACTPWEVSYLDQAANHATQTEVTERLGTPFETKSLESGKSEWTYRYQGSVVGPMAGIDTGGAYCRDYVLTFDEKGVLRNWRRERC